MSLFFGREKRGTLSTASREDFRDVWGTGGTWGGPNDPLSLIPLYAAVRLIADQGASMPLQAYRDVDGTKTRATDPPLLRSPSPSVDLFSWKFQAFSSLLLRGNAYGWLTYGASAGWPTGCEWIDPDQVVVDESGSRPEYYVGGVYVPPEYLLHIPGFVQPGSCVGLTPVEVFRTAIDAGVASQELARDWYDGNGMPGGVLRNTVKQLVDDEAQAAKRSFKKSVRNGDVFVTGSDWEFSSLRAKAEDVAFLQSIRANATQIATIFGVPPQMIGGESANPQTYSNVESDALNFVNFGLRPYTTRVEQAVTSLMSRPLYARFAFDVLLRADSKTRAEVYALHVQNGVRTRNEVRALEDLPPIDGGDELLKPNASQPTELPGADASTEGDAQA